MQSEEALVPIHDAEDGHRLAGERKAEDALVGRQVGCAARPRDEACASLQGPSHAEKPDPVTDPATDPATDPGHAEGPSGLLCERVGAEVGLVVAIPEGEGEGGEGGRGGRKSLGSVGRSSSSGASLPQGTLSEAVEEGEDGSDEE